MTIDTQTHRAEKGAFRDKTFPKHQIVLHYTAGSSVSGCAASFRKSGAGTAYILAPDGLIYEWFSPEYWDSHLYRHKTGERKELYHLEQTTIGIEIVNIGPLIDGIKIKSGDPSWLYTYTHKKWCLKTQFEKYVQWSWKRYDYWATYTMDQYHAVAELCRALGNRFGIPLVCLNTDLTPIPIETLMNHTGITTHCNYRADKLDVGPAWDYAMFEKLLMADVVV